MKKGGFVLLLRLGALFFYMFAKPKRQATSLLLLGALL